MTLARAAACLVSFEPNLPATERARVQAATDRANALLGIGD